MIGRTELKDEKVWEKAFAGTTDQQWSRMDEIVREEIGRDDSETLDAFLEEMEAG